MVLFDQQPMGPVPARRPILMPPDPELEALMSDPATAEVTLVGPVPMELVEPLGGPRRPPAGRWLRWVVALVLVVPTLFNLVWVVIYLVGDDPDSALMRVARMVGGGVLLAILVIALLWFLRRRRSPAG
ncbi:MAG: hypothetical protein ACOH1Y_01360 [Propionicimonas sp.]